MYNLIAIMFIGMIFMLAVAYVVKTICRHTEDHPDRNVSIDLRAPGFRFKAETSAAKAKPEGEGVVASVKEKPRTLKFKSQ